MSRTIFRQQLLVQMVRQTLVITALAAITALLVNAVRPDGIALIGDWSTGVATFYGDDVDLISLGEAALLHEQQQQALFVDARSEDEYRQGHIAGSLSLPVDQAEARFLDVIGQLYESDLIIAYCDGESCSLSHDLALFLHDLGVENIRVLVNGWTLWQEAGLPISEPVQ